MNWTECVLDASMGYRGGFCFCPIEGDINGEFVTVTGMNFLGLPPKDMKMVAIIHPDGQKAVESFCEQYHAELEALEHTLATRG